MKQYLFIDCGGAGPEFQVFLKEAVELKNLRLSQYRFTGFSTTGGVPDDAVLYLNFDNAPYQLTDFVTNTNVRGIPLLLTTEAGIASTFRTLDPPVQICNYWSSARIQNFKVRVTNSSGNTPVLSRCSFWFEYDE